MSDLMTIGEFAARSRLSLKALRLYDAKGLLVPAYVDPRTGFRHYGADQLERARRIALLRGLGMPLAVVGDVLDLDGEKASGVVADYWRAVEAEHAARRSMVAYVCNVLLGERAGMYEIKERDVPEQKLVTIQRHVTADKLPTFIPETHKILFAHLEASGAPVTGAPLVIYHGMVSGDSTGPVEVAVPTSGPVEPAGEIAVRLEPAHHEAYTTLTKGQVAFPHIMQAYDAVGAWLRENGKTETASPREVYFDWHCWEEMSDDDPAVDIAFPC